MDESTTTASYENGYSDGHADLEPARTDGPYWVGWCDGNEDYFYHRALMRRSQPHLID